ncbi:MAG: hypothetical protein O7F08_12885 [Deltaproteobacteria bacterium]|nr:hypothetical protein [Deltaproteobacteria bacterium]
MTRPWLLAGGMLVGAALAVFYIARVPDTAVPIADVAVWVNDRAVSRESYEQALAAVAGDRKEGTLREEDRQRVLDRLVDQELLIDRAIELGLHERDPQIRNQLVTAMIDFLVRQAEDDARAADESELREFYRSESFRFERNPQYRIGVEGSAIPLPDGFLLAKEIEQRLGPTAASKVTELEVGDSAVIASSRGDLVVTLIERRGGGVAPFEEAREAVEAAYLRAQGEAAVREFLKRARQRSDIRVEVEQ